MVTTPQEYLQLLYLIQDSNPPKVAVLAPSTEKILNIDLDSRVIEEPEYLSVETDHRSEVIHFRVNRYFDNVDLSTMNCVIQFINAAGESGIFVVPFFDTTTYFASDEMLIPWVVEGKVTAAAGEVKYSIQFFKVAPGGKKYVYNLNTLTATGKILHGNEFDKLSVHKAAENEFSELLASLKKDGKVDFNVLAGDLDLDMITDEDKINFNYMNGNLGAAYEILIDKMNEAKSGLSLKWIEA